jgi:peptidoglycan-associated lipoprotein
VCDAGQECSAGICRLPPPPPDPCQELGSVFFPPGSAALTEKSRATLAEDASCLLSRSVRAVIEGHADDGMTPEYNAKLGSQRSEAVRKYLLGLGVKRALLSTIGHGDTRRVCTETTEACRQRNRRVDLKIQP